MMIHSPLTHRRGLTLTEALVAMFVAAIGMISLLALFPLGALQMGLALKDSRCTETATNAEALMRLEWQKYLDTGIEPFTPETPATSPFNTYSSGPSDPVFVDPVGRNSNTINPRRVGGMTFQPILPVSSPQSDFPRRTLNILNPPILPLIPQPPGKVFRFCSLLDDMTFDESGAPVITGSRVERAGRYNWSAVLQRPSNSLNYIADLTILVFDGRSVGFSPPDNEMVYGDPAIPNRVHLLTPGSSLLQLRFPIADNRPPIGKGRWLAIYTPSNRLLTFHRVVGVNEDSSTATETHFDCELQTPVATGHNPADCRVIVFAGLAEVFERSPLTPN